MYLVPGKDKKIPDLTENGMVKKMLLYSIYKKNPKDEDKPLLDYTYDAISQPIAFFIFFVFKGMKAMSRAKPIDLEMLKEENLDSGKKKKKKRGKRKMTLFNLDAVEEIRKQKHKSKKALTEINSWPNCSEFLKAMIREKRLPKPFVPKEKGTAFKYLLREYLFKFNLTQGGNESSAFWAGRTVNLMLKKA